MKAPIRGLTSLGTNGADRSGMRVSRLGVVLLAAALASACTSTPATGSAAGAESAGSEVADGPPSGELIVFAAASLTDAFEAIIADFEKSHPGIDVKSNFAGSQSLRTQIQNGAQPQVFVSANEQHMDALRAARLVDEPVVFVQNELVIAVPADNPAGIASLEDLPRAERLVLAGENVPAGAYARHVLARASAAYGADFAERVDRRVVSRETHVRQTLQKVILGEADAAIVYATDAASASSKGDAIRTIAIAPEHNVTASYPIATVTGAPRSELGALFIEFVRSDAGAAHLLKAGFRPVDTEAGGE